MEQFPTEQPGEERVKRPKERSGFSKFITGAAIIASIGMAAESALGDEPKPKEPKKVTAEEMNKIGERLKNTTWYEGIDTKNPLDSKVGNIRKLTLTPAFADWWAERGAEEARTILEDRKLNEAAPLGLKAASALFSSVTGKDAFVRSEVSEQEASRVIEKAIEQAGGIEKVLVRVLIERKNWVSGARDRVTDWKTFDPSKTKLEGVLLSEQFAQFLIKRNGAEKVKSMLSQERNYVPFPLLVQEFTLHLKETKVKLIGDPYQRVTLSEVEAVAHKMRMLAATK